MCGRFDMLADARVFAYAPNEEDLFKFVVLGGKYQSNGYWICRFLRRRCFRAFFDGCGGV